MFVCWVDGLADGEAIAEDILRPLTEPVRAEGLTERRLLDLLERGGVYRALSAGALSCPTW